MQRRRKTTKEERICSICSQAFAKSDHLERHIRSHTKEKPYRCPTCNKRFARQDTLLRHSRSHHPDAPIRPETTQSAPSHDGDDQSPLEMGPMDSGRMQALAHISALELAQQSPAPALEPNRLPQALPPDATMFGTDGTMGVPMDRPADMAPAEVFPCDYAVPDQQQYAWLPQWDAEMNLDAQWLADFVGEKLDVNLFGYPTPALMSDAQGPPLDMIRADTAVSEQTPDMTYSSGMSEASSNRVQKRWHTFSEEVSSGHATPALTKNRYQLDENYHQDLVDRLRPKVQEGSVPSTSFLNLAIQAYFANFHPIFPILHAPSFRPHNRNGLLVLSICSVGSLFLGSSHSVAQGISIYERLHKALLSSWDVRIMAAPNSAILALQASIIGQIFALLIGRSRDLLQVDLFHGTVLAWSRRLKLFRQQELDVDISQLEGQDLESAWMDWIEIEQRKRAALALLLQDSQIGLMFHHDSGLRSTLEQLPSISSNEAFSAHNAVVWKSITMKETANRLAQASSMGSSNDPHMSALRDVSSDFELHIMLDRIAWKCCPSHNPAARDAETVQQTRNLLIAWLKRYRETPAFQRHVSSLMMQWHAVFMLLHMDMDKLESFCGREGSEVAGTLYTEVEEWARSNDARICIIHAILTQQHFERLPVGTEPPLHFPICLYRCGIAWFCYIRFMGRGGPPATGPLNLPELQVLDVCGVTLFQEEASMRDGRPATSSVFKIIHLLQRAHHRRLAHNLASTLLALVEEGQDIS